MYLLSLKRSRHEMISNFEHKKNKQKLFWNWSNYDCVLIPNLRYWNVKLNEVDWKIMAISGCLASLWNGTAHFYID
jgi:hypothetical protein